MRVTELLICRKGDHNRDLLSRAGYIHPSGHGLYSLLPLGTRVLQKIKTIVRREFDSAGAQEVAMSLLQPPDIWQCRIGGSTRAEAFGPQLFRVRGGSGDDLILAPTHEEAATMIAAACVEGTTKMPKTIFQIQPRFRDHEAASFPGLERTREFVMADAYSFHADTGSLAETYDRMKSAFANILKQCSVDATVVKANSGAMGGDQSEELIAPLPDSTSAVALECSACGYAASRDIAEFGRTRSDPEGLQPMNEVPTSEIAETTNWLACKPFVAGGTVLLVVLPRYLRLDGEKLLNALAKTAIPLKGFHEASAEELVEAGADWDWLSLVRTPSSVFVIADESVRASTNFAFPSARQGYSLLNVKSGRDFRVDQFADIAVAENGYPCIRCEGPLRAIYGIEVGHLFKLGTGYSSILGARTASGIPLQMGCYGLGVTRLISTVVQQNRDARGIVWPPCLAPYAAVISPASSESGCRSFSEQIYHKLQNLGMEVLLDDTEEVSETKFAFADLLGIPLTIIADGAHQPMVELRHRKSGTSDRIHADALPRLLYGVTTNSWPAV